MTEDQLELLRDKFVLWDRASREGNMELRDYNRRAADAIKCLLAEHSEAFPAPACNCEDAQPYKDALDDLLFCRGEQLAIGGGPGWKEREAKAWAAAEELMRVET